MKKFIVSAICVMAMASCQTQQSLYSWYDSEDATYTYTKRGTEETLTKAMAQYEKVITNRKDYAKSFLLVLMPSMVTSFARQERKRRAWPFYGQKSKPILNLRNSFHESLTNWKNEEIYHSWLDDVIDVIMRRAGYSSCSIS